MKKDIHPKEYREVLFHDVSVDEYILVRSTLQTEETKKWTDGNTYPYCPLDVSSASHPFLHWQTKAGGYRRKNRQVQQAIWQ